MASEQIGNDLASTMTPGSAMAGQLQNILAQKRVAAQQALQNQMAQQTADLQYQNVESQIRDRDANVAANAENRKSIAESRLAQELGRRTGLLTKGQPLVGSDADFIQKNAPSLLVPGQPAQYMPDYAAGEQGPGISATQPTFAGTPKQNEADRKQQLQDDLFKKMQDPTSGWDNLPDAAKEAQYMQAFGKSAPENVLRPKVGGRALVFDQARQTLTDLETGKPARSVGPNDKVLTADRDQRPLQQHYQDLGPETDENGKITGNRILLDTTTGEPTIRSGLRVGPKATPKASAAPEIKPGEMSKITALRGKVTPQTFLGKNVGGPFGRDTKPVQDFREAAISAVSKLNLPQEVEDAFTKVMDDDKSEDFSSQEIADAHTKLSPENRALLLKALRDIRGK